MKLWNARYQYIVLLCFLYALQFHFDGITNSLFFCFRKQWRSLIRYFVISDSPPYPEFFIFLRGSEIMGQLVSTEICITSIFVLFSSRSCEYLPTDVHFDTVSDFTISVLHCVWRSSSQERQKNVALFTRLNLSSKRLIIAIVSLNDRNTKRNIVIKTDAASTMCSRQFSCLHLAVTNVFFLEDRSSGLLSRL
jgi:hypothetical protein